ncbi:MAG: integrase, partial [Acetobacter sp.]|nr:integrase [Acetobacter sp.]
ISDTNACLRDVAERTLAYAIENKVEAAYRRSDLLEQRNPLMETWAKHCRRLT